MQSDAFRCVGKRFDISGIFGSFRLFQTILVIFGPFLVLGAYFYGRFMYRGLTTTCQVKNLGCGSHARQKKLEEEAL